MWDYRSEKVVVATVLTTNITTRTSRAIAFKLGANDGAMSN
jgi:hypothetical protein